MCVIRGNDLCTAINDIYRAISITTYLAFSTLGSYYALISQTFD